MNQNIFTQSPLSAEQLESAEQLLTTLTSDQLQWLNGYLTGIAKANSGLLELVQQHGVNGNLQTQSESANSSLPNTLKIFYGTHSGNSKEIAYKAHNLATSQGIASEVIDVNEYNARNLKKEKNIIIIISTHGEGEPPIEAEEFYNFIQSKKTPQLTDINYGVIALGDSSYKQFCKIGIDIDKRLAECGAKRIHEVAKCDLDFEEPSEKWLEKVIPKFKDLAPKADASSISSTQAQTSFTTTAYSKRNPFGAEILDRIKLNGKGSKKETYHIELSLDGSGLTYEPGDSLGVYSENDEKLVDELLKKLNFDPHHKITVNKEEKSLKEALTHNYELTIITPIVIQNYAQLTNNKDLLALLNNEALLDKYLYGRDVLDLVTEYPANISVEDFISLLRKLPARLYSIASSMEAYEDEVHVTVGTVRYSKNNRSYEGVCSNFLSNRINDDSKVSIYIDKNEGFRLPKDPETPIIMIGPGTGIAPFRAFVQHRDKTGASGKNWLFFGDQHFTTDFLYQEEWLKYKKKGIVQNLDVAFSRDQDEKVYVQHKMYEKGKELYQWLEDGAYVYICGDKHNMAKDVKRALFNIISKEGGFTDELASEYFDNLKRSKRILEDVY